MALHPEAAAQEEELEEHGGGAPTHHPSAPSDELFDISTTVDPSYIISLIRKLLLSGSRNSYGSREGEVSDAPNQRLNSGNMEETEANPSHQPRVSSRNESGHLNIGDGHNELADEGGECENMGDSFEKPGDSVGVEIWEEYGCILWDLAGTKTHAKLMVQNFILEVLLANLMVSKSVRITEISIGIMGNLACHEILMKHIVSTNGLIEIIVDQLFLDDAQCLNETFRLLTLGIQSCDCIAWSKALGSEHILSRILWVVENTLNLQLSERSIGLILAALESQQKVVNTLLPILMKLGLGPLLISLLAFEMSKLMSERIPERYVILDVILRVIEALSIIDDYSQDICSNRELFQLVCDLVKLSDKVEVASSCVTAAVLIANILSDFADQISYISGDVSFLQGLLDIFPFASDDEEARSAIWSLIAKLLLQFQGNEISPSNLYNHVAVLVSKADIIEDELLNQQSGGPRYENGSLAPASSKLDPKTISLRCIVSTLNRWAASKDDAENLMGAPLTNDGDVNRLLSCCCKYLK